MEREHLERIYRTLKFQFKKDKFSKTQFMKYILHSEPRKYYSRSLPYLISQRLNFDEDVANAILNEFLSKSVIESVKGKNLDDWYKLV